MCCVVYVIVLCCLRVCCTLEVYVLGVCFWGVCHECFSDMSGLFLSSCLFWVLFGVLCASVREERRAGTVWVFDLKN